ncbi:MAG: hypothetical protein JWM10_1145 [Myxococcaceae bacterium]|nr:hypothetical protein [Myxococcaceae bacterium]
MASIGRRFIAATGLAALAALAMPPGEVDAQRRRAGREEVRLAVGETWRISAARIRTYAESGPGVVEAGVSPDARWFRVRAVRPGTNVVLVTYAGGSQRSYTFVVTP